MNFSQCLDRGMKVAFEEFHLWFQFALSLISAGKVSTETNLTLSGSRYQICSFVVIYQPQVVFIQLKNLEKISRTERDMEGLGLGGGGRARD